MKKIFVAIALILSVSAIHSQDRYFARVYGSNILPKGGIDLELFHTSRIGHKDQFYHAQDQRMEIEVGLGKDWQTAFYFNRYQQRFSTDSNGTTTSNEIGFSNEWKWKALDQAKSKIGLSFYGEWGTKGGDELELETKIILDKWVKKNYFAFNAVTEYEKEWEWLNGKTESGGWQLPVELDFGYMYSLKPDLGIGFEIVNHNDITKEDGWKHSVFFGGPTLNYRGDGWFVIANYLPQWGNIHKTSLAPSGKVLDDHERTEIRIVFGITIK